jgi:hypothetical protein
MKGLQKQGEGFVKQLRRPSKLSVRFRTSTLVDTDNSTLDLSSFIETDLIICRRRLWSYINPLLLQEIMVTPPPQPVPSSFQVGFMRLESKPASSAIYQVLPWTVIPYSSIDSQPFSSPPSSPSSLSPSSESESVSGSSRPTRRSLPSPLIAGTLLAKAARTAAFVLVSQI